MPCRRGGAGCRTTAWHRADHRVMGEVSGVIHGVELDAGTSYSRRTRATESNRVGPCPQLTPGLPTRVGRLWQDTGISACLSIVRARLKPTGWGALPARRRVVRAGRSVPPSLAYRSVTGVPVVRLRCTAEITYRRVKRLIVCDRQVVCRRRGVHPLRNAVGHVPRPRRTDGGYGN